MNTKITVIKTNRGTIHRKSDLIKIDDYCYKCNSEIRDYRLGSIPNIKHFYHEHKQDEGDSFYIMQNNIDSVYDITLSDFNVVNNARKIKNNINKFYRTINDKGYFCDVDIEEEIFKNLKTLGVHKICDFTQDLIMLSESIKSIKFEKRVDSFIVLVLSLLLSACFKSFIWIIIGSFASSMNLFANCHLEKTVNKILEDYKY